MLPLVSKLEKHYRREKSYKSEGARNGFFINAKMVSVHLETSFCNVKQHTVF